jgi:prepilin-type N-terminal cleavage/methylation domain-containing protein
MPHLRARRGGFTLIELLVVIAIIGILASLISAAVLRYLDRQPEVYNRDQISQMAIALQDFNRRFGFYPPSEIKLCQRRSDYGNTQLDLDSVYYITRMFKNIGWVNTPVMWNGGNGVPIPTGSGAKNANGTILEGDQCLVFFLGGIPGPSGQTLGFSTNPANPAAGGATPIGPFMRFNAAKLKARTIGSAQATASGLHGFYSYLDYGDIMPFVYFSPVKSANNYNTPNNGGLGYSNGQFIDFTPALPTEHLSVSPYAKSNIGGLNYWNPDTYQIICAGKDSLFGPGNQPLPAKMFPTILWTSNFAANYDTATRLFNLPTGAQVQGNGQDDITNFYDAVMGVSQ